MLTTIDHLPTHYQRLGRGRPLILLHGWGGSWESWAPLIPSLSEHFELLIPDLPAFGQSAAPRSVGIKEAWKTADYAQWLLAFTKTVIPDQTFCLAGHSFGGKIAALFAATKHPTTLKKLILIDSAGLPDPLPWPRALQNRVLKLVPTIVKERLGRRFKARLLSATGTATDHFYSSPEQRRVFQATIREHLAGVLPKIHVPTLILWGETDAETPVHQAQQFAELIPQSELMVISQAGHFPFIDNPELCLKKILEFCRSS